MSGKRERGSLGHGGENDLLTSLIRRSSGQLSLPLDIHFRLPMDFFSLPHERQQAAQNDNNNAATELFARAIDERFSAASAIPAPALTNNRVTPMSLTLPSPPRPPQPPSPHVPIRPQTHHLPASSPSASLFTAIHPADLPEILADPHALILDLRPLPTYFTSRIPHALPLSVPSTLLKRPLFSTSKLADMLPNRAARRKFSQWRLARRILVYDADSTLLPEGNNILGLLRKFRAEAGLDVDPLPSGAAGSSQELRLSWLKGGFQAVLREQQTILDINPVSDQDDDEDSPSPPAFPVAGPSTTSESVSLPSAQPRQMALSLPTASRPTVLRTKNLPMSAFTMSTTTSQRSGSGYHKYFHGQQAVRDFVSPGSAPGPVYARPGLISRGSSTGAGGGLSSDPGPNVAYNPFYDTIRQNLELSHGVTERIPLKISRIAKDRIDDLPFAWLRELGRWAIVDDEGSDEEDNVHEGMSGSGSGSGASGSDHSGMSSDSGEDSGSGREHADRHLVRTHLAAAALAVAPLDHTGIVPDDAEAEGSEALAMQFYRIELGEQRRLMGVMKHHSKESGKVIEESDAQSGSKTKTKRSKRRNRGTGHSSRGKQGPREFPYSITAGVEKGTKNRYRNIWPFEHARVRLQKQKPKRPTAKPLTPPRDWNTGSLRPLSLPTPSEFLPPLAVSISGGRSIQLPLTTPLASTTTSDDYVNASYVQPLGTTKRYIATQGPLPETFNDFWLLVWEQNVHVIVMLTREVEGSTVKCGNYWSGDVFGPLRLKLVEVSGAVEEYQQVDSRANPGDFFFPVVPDLKPSAEPSGESALSKSTVKRVLELSHTSFPHIPPRRITQFQYLDWPDLNVPNDTLGVLELIREVEREAQVSEGSRGSWEGSRRPDEWDGRSMIGAVRPRRTHRRPSREASPSGAGSSGSGGGGGSSGSSSPSLDAIDSDCGIMKHALRERPVLLHCSAGVGRTGGFIAIDAVLDGVRREIHKQREGLRVVPGPGSDSQVGVSTRSGSGSGRESADRTGDISGSNLSDKDRASSSDEVAAMDIDEVSAGGRAALGPGLVLALPVEDKKQPLHIPVVGMVKGVPSSSRQRGKEGALVYVAPMDVDAITLAATSPWTTTNPRSYLETWTPTRPGATSSSSSGSAKDARNSNRSSDPALSGLPPALSRSLSPSGDDGLSDGSALSLGLSMHISSNPQSFSLGGSVSSRIPPHHRTLSSLSASLDENQRLRTFSAPTAAPRTNAFIAPVSPPTFPQGAGPLQPAAEIAQPVAKRVGGHPDAMETDLGSDSSRGPSTGVSSLLSVAKSGTPETLPTDPSVMDLTSVTKGDLGKAALSGPSQRHSTTRKTMKQSSNSPPQNEDSPPQGSDPLSSQSQSHSELHSPPAFDYTEPRRLHDNRHSPPLLSTLDEPIHRVIEDMREQRMSLCQSLRQYVFVHRAVIEGVLMLVDEERVMYGAAWKDTGAEDAKKAGAVRFPTQPAAATGTSESGSIDSAAGTSGSAAAGSFTGTSLSRRGSRSKNKSSGDRGSLSPSKGKRRASPTELPKEDKRGDARMSKRPSIKRRQRSSDENSSQEGREAAGAAQREENALETPLAMR
ncbi:hypothetical protein BC834DRAFT_841188 [Gloeopeniophorella convolvens]|nr:hypothetical protein BC834DRAFT_841188 [Gloeopeniophorella convolvens]